MTQVLALPAESSSLLDCPPACPESTQSNVSYADLPGQWFVICARPNYERRVNADLEDNGLTPYLPLVRVRKRYPETRTSHGGVKVLETPLFSRYLFCNSRFEFVESYYRIREVENCQIVIVSDQTKLRREISAVETALKLNPTLDANLRLQVGNFCTITAGPFMGQSGNIVGLKGSKHLVAIRIETLGRSLNVELDESDVELIC